MAPNGEAYNVGSTDSADFPTEDAFQDARRGARDAFVSKLSDEPEPAAHDLALVHVDAPRRVVLDAEHTSRTVIAGVRFQNRGTHDEVIADFEILGGLVSLTVQPLGACPAPTATLRLQQVRRLPATVHPGGRFTAFFDVTFQCANDPGKTRRRSPGHDDFTYAARVAHSALDGVPDDRPANDECPREPAPPPGPRDRGCRSPVTDVVVK